MKHVVDKRDSVRAVANNGQLVNVVYHPLENYNSHSFFCSPHLFEELSRDSVFLFHSIFKKQFPRSCEFSF